MRTLDGIHYTHVVNPGFLIRLQDTPLSLEVVEGGYVQRSLADLRDKHHWPLSPDCEPYKALVETLEDWL